VASNQFALQSYNPADDTAVWALHEWAMAETGVGPSDIPGTDDLRTIGASYLGSGGAFVVGVVDPDPTRGDTPVDSESRS
jgi:hypothetical protein